jgi:receptor protein-tyrosine kinase
MDVLLDRQIRLSDVLCATDIGKLTLLPAGTADRHATEVLASGAMRNLLKELSGHDSRRVVIFDSPPLMAASEASVLAGQMGQVVVVVEAGKTTEAVVKDALGRVELSNVVGLLLNKGERASRWDGYAEYGYEAT